MPFILKIALILITNLFINLWAITICCKLQNKKCSITQYYQTLFSIMYCLAKQT